AVSSRLAELAPRMLESMCSTFMEGSLNRLSLGRSLFPGTMIENMVKLERIVLSMVLIRSAHATPGRLLLLRQGGRARWLRKGGPRLANSQVAPLSPHFGSGGSPRRSAGQPIDPAICGDGSGSGGATPRPRDAF